MKSPNELQINPSRTVVTSFNPKTTAASQVQRNQQQQIQDVGMANTTTNGVGMSSNEDFFEEGDWVLCVTSTEKFVGCALSNGEVQIYDRHKLLQTNCYANPNGLVTDLCRVDYTNPNLLGATATDGTLTIFDIRQQSPTGLNMSCPRSSDGEEALTVSIGFDATIGAVGTNKAKIHFFDLRNTRNLVGSYNQTHTQEISRLRFQTQSGFGTTTTTTPILVSGAEDGLACIFDTSKPSEEEALSNLFSIQSPVREVGFFGPKSDGVYVLTCAESLLLYHKDESICRTNFGCRQLSQQIGYATANANNDTSQQQLEYLVDCHWDMARQELLLLAGSVKGDGGVFTVNDRGVTLAHNLKSGHRGVIRAWHSLDSNLFVTVGEDARMCEWNRSIGKQQFHSPSAGTSATTPPVVIMPKQRSVSANGTTATPMIARAGGGKFRRPKSRFSRASPY